jgi:phosphoglucosamine mutase
MLFGSSGIRQKFSGELVRTALSVGSALAARSKMTVVGMDPRTTSPVLMDATIAGIVGSGGIVLDGGTAPTPSVAYAAREYSAGCMITASHNPEDYNGLKLFNPDGSSFTRAQQEGIEKDLAQPRWAGWKDQGKIRGIDIASPHEKAILSKVTLKEDMRIVLDCGNGAGCMVTPSLLSQAGMRAVQLNCNPSGHFSRPSEPLEENLPYIGEIVRKTGSRCAVVHDGDADRMMAFDNRGRYISGDHMLMLLTEYTGAQRVVTTSDASMLVEEIAEVRRTPVGDAFVSEELRTWGDFGGEPSGAWIFPQISLCPDGPFAAALFCEIASGMDVAEKIDAMPAYPVIRKSYACLDARSLMTALGAENPTDGIRIAKEDGWCLIRASGTEPKVRITAEGKTKQAVKAMFEYGRSLLKQAKTP